MLLEPADELGLAEAGIGENAGRDVLGQQAGDRRAQPAFQLVLTRPQTLSVLDGEGEREGPVLARHSRPQDVGRMPQGPIGCDGEEGRPVSCRAIGPDQSRQDTEDRFDLHGGIGEEALSRLRR